MFSLLHAYASFGIIGYMKTLLYIILVLTSCAATAQTRLGRVRSSLLSRRSMQQQELEKPLPFEDAIEKAKVGNPQGYYSLAVHLFQGKEIKRDQEKAIKLFAMASEKDYPSAVFVSTLFNDPTHPPIMEYIGGSFLTISSSNNLTNETILAQVRAGYNRAFSLGVSAATNELNRFEAELKEANQRRKEDLARENRRLKNAKLLSEIEEPATPQDEKKDLGTYKIIYADADHISFRSEQWLDGYAHGVDRIIVGTISRKSGKKLSAADLIAESRRANVLTNMQDKINKMLNGNMLNPAFLTDNCCLAADGVHFVFNEYQIAPFLEGVIEAVVGHDGTVRTTQYGNTPKFCE